MQIPSFSILSLAKTDAARVNYGSQRLLGGLHDGEGEMEGRPKLMQRQLRRRTWKSGGINTMSPP